MDSVFGAYPCPESAAGTTGCSMMGTQALADCHMTISTISASATGLGTWYSITYLWDSQMTIVVVGEGAVEVTPVVELEFAGEVPPLPLMEPRERALAARRVEVQTRVEGEPVPVEVGEGQAAFLYTAPDAKLEELRLNPDLPDRTWHSTEQLPILVEQIQVIEPEIRPWLDRVWDGARIDGIDLGPRNWPEVENQLDIVTFGPAWDDPQLQESLLFGADWGAVTEETMGQPTRVQVARLDPSGGLLTTRPDAREVGYNPDQARELMAAAGYDALEGVVLVPDGDAELLNTAEILAQQMQESGFSLTVELVPEAEIQNRMAAMSAAGIPGMVMTRP
jgi:hypothetical protein